MQVDPILEERVKKCDELIKIFKQIYESSYLKKHMEQGDNENNLAYAFFIDLQDFLKSYDNNNRIIVNTI